MTATLWVCRVGAAKYPDLDSLHFGYAGIGWITNRAVMDFPTRKELYNGITRFDSESDHKQGVKVLWNFAHEMRIGDTLVFPYFLRRVETVCRRPRNRGLYLEPQP